MAPIQNREFSAASSNAVKTASWLNSTAYSKKGRSLRAREVNFEARESMGNTTETKTLYKTRKTNEGENANKVTVLGPVMNPVCGLLPDRHQRSLLHHIDFHSTQAVIYDSGLQFPSSTALTSHTQLFALITLTPENHLTITQLT